MKKLLIALCAAVLSTTAFAEIQQGTWHLSVLGGAATPSSSYAADGGDRPDVSDAAFGKTGIMYGIQALYNVTSAVGLGVEFNGAHFGTEDSYDEWTGLLRNDVWAKSDIYQLMFAGKLTFAPHHPVRFYVPFGAGLAHFKSETEWQNSILGNVQSGGSNSGSSTRPAWYVGAGVEVDLSQKVFLGGEVRYDYFKVDGDEFMDNDHFSYVGFLLKLGYKF